MGLIKSTFSAVRGTLGDQWLEFMSLPDNLPKDVLLAKGQFIKKNSSGLYGSSNTKGTGAITDGSRIVVPEGYSFLVVENGEIKDIVTEEGQYIWNTGTQPSVFSGSGVISGIKEAFSQIGDKIKFGGQFANQQTGVYVRLTEIMNNKFGTPSLIPYDDTRYGNIYIKGFGIYSFKIVNPILFISNVSGLSFGDFVTVSDLFDEQLKSEFIMNLISTISTIGHEKSMPFDMFIANSTNISTEISQKLTDSWSKNRGLSIVSVSIQGIEPDDESKEYIREIDKATKIGNIPGYVTMRQLDAMNKLAENEGGTTPNLFMGMGMGQVFGQNMVNMGGVNQNQQVNQQSYNNVVQSDNSVVPTGKPKFCSECGNKLSGVEKFCPNCGSKL